MYSVAAEAMRTSERTACLTNGKNAVGTMHAINEQVQTTSAGKLFCAVSNLTSVCYCKKPFDKYLMDRRPVFSMCYRFGCSLHEALSVPYGRLSPRLVHF